MLNISNTCIGCVYALVLYAVVAGSRRWRLAPHWASMLPTMLASARLLAAAAAAAALAAELMDWLPRRSEPEPLRLPLLCRIAPDVSADTCGAWRPRVGSCSRCWHAH
jgi:hypothetical protein